MPASRAKYSQDEDDVVGLAGWLFTDLLLGLVIVFLATASFQVFGSGNTGSVPCVTEKTYYSTPLRLEYQNASDAEENISQDIKKFATVSKLGGPKVAVGLIWGNYSTTETAQAGVLRAWDFYIDGLQQADSINFPDLPGYKSEISKNMRFLGESSNRRSINSVRIELYFIYDQCTLQSTESS
jgi:hypothetical protein